MENNIVIWIHEIPYHDFFITQTKRVLSEINSGPTLKSFGLYPFHINNFRHLVNDGIALNLDQILRSWTS